MLIFRSKLLGFGMCDAAVPQSQLFRLRRWRGGSTQFGVASSTVAAQETALEWVKKDNRRMLHVVYRVGDLDRTIKYAESQKLVLLCWLF